MQMLAISFLQCYYNSTEENKTDNESDFLGS